jgi:hypothetical protein
MQILTTLGYMETDELDLKFVSEGMIVYGDWYYVGIDPVFREYVGTVVRREVVNGAAPSFGLS